MSRRHPMARSDRARPTRFAHSTRQAVSRAGGGGAAPPSGAGTWVAALQFPMGNNSDPGPVARASGRAGLLRRHPVVTAFAICLVVLVGLRVALPYAVALLIERQADELLNGRLEIGDVDLGLVRGQIALRDVAAFGPGRRRSERRGALAGRGTRRGPHRLGLALGPHDPRDEFHTRETVPRARAQRRRRARLAAATRAARAIAAGRRFGLEAGGGGRLDRRRPRAFPRPDRRGRRATRRANSNMWKRTGSRSTPARSRNPGAWCWRAASPARRCRSI